MTAVTATHTVATTRKTGPFAAVAEQAAAVGQDQHVGEQHGRDHPVDHLGLYEQLDEVAGNQRDGGPDHDLAGEQAQEQPGFAEALAHGTFRADGLAQRVGGRQRHDRCRQRGRAQQAQREQLRGEPARDRPQRQRRLLRGGQRRAGLDRRGGRDDDEYADQVGEDRAADRVHPFLAVVSRADAFVGDRGSNIKLHVRGDGRADQGHREQEERLAAGEVRPDELARRLGQVRAGQHGGDRVGQERQGQDEEDPLGVPVRAEDHQRPDHHHRDRNGHVFADPDQLQRGGDPGELRHDQPDVGEQERQQRERRDPQRELLTDQCPEPFAGVSAQPGAHLLHHDQRHGDQHHQEQGLVAELGPRRGVGGDSAGVVAGIRRDQAGAGEGKRQQQPPPPPRPPGPARRHRCGRCRLRAAGVLPRGGR